MTSTALDAILSGEPPAAVETLRRMGVAEPISTAIVLGTGLGSLADAVDGAIVTPYAELPGFPQSKVSGHAGRLVIGQLEGQRVALLQGRSHYYESGAAAAMATPLATVAALGARTVLLTNSAGSLRNTWHPGTVVVISDHINYAGMNPLIGDTSDKRFVSMTEAYDRRLRERLHKAAASVGLKPQEGVYIWFSGPSFETPAEVRMARLLGGDVVGMSTVPETILARRLGLRVAAISVITNFGAGIGGADPSHSETKDVALAGTIALRKLARAFIKMRDD